MREFWIHKGESRFADELRMNDDFELVKVTPDSFYDLVSPNDTIEGGIHVREVLPEALTVDEDSSRQYVMRVVIPNLETWVERSLIDSVHESYKAGAEWQKAWIVKNVNDAKPEIEARVREQTVKEVLNWLDDEAVLVDIEMFGPGQLSSMIKSKFLNGEAKK